MSVFEVRPGDPEYLGTKSTGNGINFAISLQPENDAQLVIVNRKGKILQTVELPPSGRTGCVSAVFLCGADPGSIGYYYLIDGRKTVDPYAAMIAGEICFAAGEGDDEWKNDRSPVIPVSDLMIYKLHVRGFTKKAGTAVKHKGTFAGVKEMIPYIRDLGFNAVELMPVYEFDDRLRVRPFADNTGKKEGEESAAAHNYWGYSDRSFFFSPRASYSSSADSLAEFRSMTAAFHREGMEVILEFCFPEGTNHQEAVRALRHWKIFCHVDGFHLIGAGTPVDSIVRDPLLTDTKIMLERVDPGRFFGADHPKNRNILEYNDDFERVGRLLLKGDEGQTGVFASMLRRNPPTHAYVNYMANVNGFTLFDAVSYDFKHNEANGEGNQDGTFANYSWNCGAEGPSGKKSIRELRLRQVRNALAYVFLAQGVPLLYAGDEMLNTQGGNNNAYSSDNPTGWTDWNRSKDAQEMRSFVKMLTALRKENRIFRMSRELRGSDIRGVGFPDISFHDAKAWVAAHDFPSRTLAVLYCGLYVRWEKEEREEDFFYVAYNSYWDAHSFALPVLPKGYSWYPEFDTAAHGGSVPSDSAAADQKYVECAPRSVRVMRGKKN